MNTKDFIKIEKQKKLRNKTKIELERLEKIMEDDKIKNLLNAFLNKFILCETTYKVVLKKYKESKNKTTSELKLHMNQIPHALMFAGYTFDKDFLNELFGSKKGTTVKKLRDAITHGFNQKAINEIILREEEIFGYMDSFLNTIKTFDNSTI